MTYSLFAVARRFAIEQLSMLLSIPFDANQNRSIGCGYDRNISRRVPVPGNIQADSVASQTSSDDTLRHRPRRAMREFSPRQLLARLSFQRGIGSVEPSPCPYLRLIDFDYL